MLTKLILAAVILYLLWSAMRQLKSVPLQRKKQMIWRGALFALIALMVLGALTGRAHWLGALFAALIPLLRFGTTAAFKLLPFWLSRGGTVPVKTEYLDVKIELRSGRISGTVRKGDFAGRAFESLTAEELKQLTEICAKEDSKAHYLLRYVARQQNGPQREPPPDFGRPEYDEALQILGLKGNPNRDEIIAAHKRLIHKLHPDRGGSDFLAARVNQARDVLLKGHEK